MNEVAFKPEYIFITYDDVLRSRIPTIIAKLIKCKDEYSDFIDYTRIENKSITDILWLSQIRSKYNILEYLAKKPFDYDLSMLSLCSDIEEPIYNTNNPLVMTSAIYTLLQQSFVKSVYVYADDNQHINLDIMKMCSSDLSKVHIVRGDFKEVISCIKDPISLYIVNDIQIADIIIDTAKNQYADILVADYGYNYIMDDKNKCPILKIDGIEEKAKSHNFRLNMFMPVNRENIGK